MPTYEYKCEGCGYAFDKFQSINDKPLAKCPKLDFCRFQLKDGWKKH